MPPDTGEITAVILAGGLGTRLRSAVAELPKSMAPIAGRPFLEYQFDYWIGQGVSRFLLAVGYRHEAVSGHFGSSYRGCPVDYVIEPTPMGTGGALRLVLQTLDHTKPFLLLNGDTYFAVDLDALHRFAESRGADWSFSLLRNPDSTRYMGIDIAGDGRVTALCAPSSPLINGGAYWVAPGFLKNLVPAADKPLSLENEILPQALHDGRGLYGIEFAAPFIDIGIPADYERAQTLLPKYILDQGKKT